MVWGGRSNLQAGGAGSSAASKDTGPWSFQLGSPGQGTMSHGSACLGADIGQADRMGKEDRLGQVEMWGHSTTYAVLRVMTPQAQAGWASGGPGAASFLPSHWVGSRRVRGSLSHQRTGWCFVLEVGQAAQPPSGM